MLGRFMLSCAIIAAAGGAWAQAVLDPDDEGEETITLPEDNAPFTFRNASGAEVIFYATGTRGWASGSSSLWTA